jgi:hypothetical protein
VRQNGEKTQLGRRERTGQISSSSAAAASSSSSAAAAVWNVCAASVRFGAASFEKGADISPATARKR